MSTSGNSHGSRDVWATWLLDRRSGGDDALRKVQLAQLSQLRDRVLKYAEIRHGETVLDVGCGDGLIAFGALDVVAAKGRVVFSDISMDLLEHCRALAETSGVAERCAFVQAPADDLSSIGDASVDVVTTRSVLIYVQDKRAAFREFFRVLRPGGRISLFEPINAIDLKAPEHEFNGLDMTPVAELAARLKRLYREIIPAGGPMLGFDERDLVAFAEDAGFASVKLRYEYDFSVGRRVAVDGVAFEAYLNAAPNPLAPSLNEAMAQTMTAHERERFVEHMRAASASGKVARRSAIAYLQARKGADDA